MKSSIQFTIVVHAIVDFASEPSTTPCPPVDMILKIVVSLQRLWSIIDWYISDPIIDTCGPLVRKVSFDPLMQSIWVPVGTVLNKFTLSGVPLFPYKGYPNIITLVGLHKPVSIKLHMTLFPKLFPRIYHGFSSSIGHIFFTLCKFSCEHGFQFFHFPTRKRISNVCFNIGIRMMSTFFDR